jgi:hypothetical protein
MKRVMSLCLATVAVVLLFVSVEGKAFATGYVDPGTGLLALQYIASAFAASLFFMRRRIAALFGKKSKSEVAAPATLQDTPAE